MEKDTFIDIGAGYGEYFIQRARSNPNKKYVAIEFYDPPKNLPSNLQWIKQEVNNDTPIPFSDGSVDEVNMDFLLIHVHGEDRISLETILGEAKRVVKKNGLIVIREPKYMMNILKPVFEELELKYKNKPIPLDIAKGHSLSVRESTIQYEENYEEMEPYLIVLKK